LFGLYLFTYKLLEASHRDQYFYLLFQGMTFLYIMVVVFVKLTKLVRVVCVRITFQRKKGYCTNYFLLIIINTSACIVVRGMVKSSMMLGDQK